MARIAGKQPLVVRLADRDGRERRAFRRIEAAGERLTLTARRRQRVRRQRIGPAGRIDENRLLRAAAAGSLLECIALIV
jgi:hypothetical protein